MCVWFPGVANRAPLARCRQRDAFLHLLDYKTFRYSLRASHFTFTATIKQAHIAARDCPPTRTAKSKPAKMRSTKLCETLVVIASLYYTAVAFPLFPTALPTESTVSSITKLGCTALTLRALFIRLRSFQRSAIWAVDLAHYFVWLPVQWSWNCGITCKWAVLQFQEHASGELQLFQHTICISLT